MIDSGERPTYEPDVAAEELPSWAAASIADLEEACKGLRPVPEELDGISAEVHGFIAKVAVFRCCTWEHAAQRLLVQVPSPQWEECRRMIDAARVWGEKHRAKHVERVPLLDEHAEKSSGE